MFGRRSDDDDFLSPRERWRERAWPLGAGFLVAFLLAESLDDANGDKSIDTLLLAAGIGVVVYFVTLWYRR